MTHKYPHSEIARSLVNIMKISLSDNAKFVQAADVYLTKIADVVFAADRYLRVLTYMDIPTYLDKRCERCRTYSHVSQREDGTFICQICSRKVEEASKTPKVKGTVMIVDRAGKIIRKLGGISSPDQGQAAISYNNMCKASGLKEWYRDNADPMGGHYENAEGQSALFVQEKSYAKIKPLSN